MLERYCGLYKRTPRGELKDLLASSIALHADAMIADSYRYKKHRKTPGVPEILEDIEAQVKRAYLTLRDDPPFRR